MAAEESSRGGPGAKEPEPEPAPAKQPTKKPEPAAFESPAKVRPGELLQLAPRLAEHIPLPYPEWRDVVDAAGGGLRHELGVSETLWGEACLAIGRPLAAVALAIVSTKPREHFTRGAGGYFAAMVKRAKTGELHLDRSLWKLRRDRLDRLERETPFLTDARNGDRWH